MASLKPVIQGNFVKKDGTANIKIRIFHDSKAKYIATPYSIDPKFMLDSGIISPKHPSAAKLNIAINALLIKYNECLIEMGPDVENASIESIYTFITGKEKYGESFSKYLKYRTDQYVKEKRHSYAELHRVTALHMENFAGDDIKFSEITYNFLVRLDRYLEGLGHSVNTRRIYLNNIRSVYFHAIDNDIVREYSNPFRKFKIKQERSRPRPLTVDQIKDMRALANTPARERSVDLFMLSFYLIGINFKDLLFLCAEDLRSGRLYFERFKTGRQYSIKVEPEALALIDKYRSKKRLLCFLEDKVTAPGRTADAHHDITSNVNKVLKKMMPEADISTYSARYSWATLAAGIGVSRDVIAHALGHGVNTMTDLYIDYDSELVDRANRAVIDLIKK